MKDDETKKALLIQHLKSQGEAGAPKAELRQVLPADHERGILRMLHELRDQGVIEKRGDKRGARWCLLADNRQQAPLMSDNDEA